MMAGSAASSAIGGQFLGSNLSHQGRRIRDWHTEVFEARHLRFVARRTRASDGYDGCGGLQWSLVWLVKEKSG